VLKARRYGAQATLILDGGGCGSFSILEEWTDQAAPTRAGTARRLSAPALLELVQLVRQLQEPGGSAAANQKGVDTCA